MRRWATRSSAPWPSLGSYRRRSRRRPRTRGRRGHRRARKGYTEANKTSSRAQPIAAAAVKLAAAINVAASALAVYREAQEAPHHESETHRTVPARREREHERRLQEGLGLRGAGAGRRGRAPARAGAGARGRRHARAGGRPAPEPAPAAKDLATVVAGLEKGKTFQELLVAAELDKDLTSGDVSLTILVPTDEAFAKLPKGTLDKWKKNKEQLQKALKYHFIPGLNDSAKLGNYRTAPTAAGPELPIKQSQDSEMTIDGAKLLEINIPASNGLVHVIDKVLQPPKK
ncbi:fasciclin domain-containing protein [Nannocystis exedens]|uniref:fasciclin domain-containing protein n=1 Tax=Nannocystis exedens TaxID=54 RepID=UPI000BBA057B|nr:fasciclin domain-containing protein [Nannocystis exedens]PCC66719.1 fasciclin [Nannocystis exedens]